MTRKTKGQWASLPSRLCFLLMPHHQGFASPILFDPVWSSYLCPLFIHYVKKKWDCFLFFFPTLTIYCPPPSTPIYLSLTSFLFFFFPLPSSLPCFHPFHPVRTGMCLCVNLSEISLFRRLTASMDSEGTASSQDMKNASHKFVIRPWVIMAKAPITSD